MHTGFYWEKLESKRPIGRPGHRGKVVIDICNRSAILGFSDVCLPNHDAAFHVIVISHSKVRFFKREYFGKRLDGLLWMTADISITFSSLNTKSTV